MPIANNLNREYLHILDISNNQYAILTNQPLLHYFRLELGR